MAKATFKCPKCDRTFSMAAHLARHMNTIHSTKSGARRTKRKAARAKTKSGHPRKAGTRPSVRSKASTAWSRQTLGEGQTRLMDEMQTYHSTLMAQRSALDAQIEGVTRAMQAIGAVVPARPAARGVRKGWPTSGGARAGSLKDYIVRVLRQHPKPMSPREISSRVLSAGFKTKARDITKAVSNTLPKLKNVKRVGFGAYQLSGGTA